MQQYHDDPLIIPAVAPHAIYTNDDADSQGQRASSPTNTTRQLVIHLSETKTRE